MKILSIQRIVRAGLVQYVDDDGKASAKTFDPKMTDNELESSLVLPPGGHELPPDNGEGENHKPPPEPPAQSDAAPPAKTKATGTRRKKAVK